MNITKSERSVFWIKVKMIRNDFCTQCINQFAFNREVTL